MHSFRILDWCKVECEIGEQISHSKMVVHIGTNVIGCTISNTYIYDLNDGADMEYFAFGSREVLNPKSMENQQETTFLIPPDINDWNSRKEVLKCEHCLTLEETRP